MSELIASDGRSRTSTVPAPAQNLTPPSSSSRPSLERAIFGVSYLAAAVAGTVVLPTGHGFSEFAPAAAVLLAVSTRFYLRQTWGWIGCQQAAFVLLMFTAPLNLVPLIALGCWIAGDREREPNLRYVLQGACNQWYALIAAVLLSALAPGPAAWQHWQAYVETFAGEFLIATGILALRCRVRGDRMLLSEEIAVLAVDACLTPIGLTAAVDLRSAPAGALALMTGAIGLLAMVDHERRGRLTETERARKDSLTALANRALFEEAGVACESRCRRTGLDAGLLLIDLDEFKPINDTFGHQAGDLVLRGFAARLRNATRSVDVPARLGGDEFAVILGEPMDLARVTQLADILRERLSEPVRLPDGQPVPVSFSVGHGLFGSETSFEAAVAAADAALYEDKRARRAGR